MVTADKTQTEMRYSSQQFFDLKRLFDKTCQYELHSGTIVKMAPSSMMPSVIAARILGYLARHLADHDSGFLTGADGAYVLSDDTTFAPDVGYIAYASQPELLERGFVPNAPDLAVEVLSPTDNPDELRQKANTYLQHGTRLVWLVFPAAQQIDIYQPDTDPQTLTLDDTLSGVPLLPEFEVRLREIFITRQTDTDTA
jgi:Uma2 family endonuclease